MTNFVTNRKLILKTILLVKLRSANFKPEPLNLAKGEGGEKQKETLGPTIKEKSWETDATIKRIWWGQKLID